MALQCPQQQTPPPQQPSQQERAPLQDPAGHTAHQLHIRLLLVQGLILGGLGLGLL